MQVRVRIDHPRRGGLLQARELLRHDLSRVELREERRRFLELAARRQLARLPGADPGLVVAGQNRMGHAVLVDLLKLERAGEDAVVTQELVEALRRERQERREERLQAVDCAEGDVQDRPGPLSVALDQRPWRLVVQVAVRLARDAEGFRERGAEARGLDLGANRVEGLLD